MFGFNNITLQYLINKIKELIPTQTSQLTNDSDFLTNVSKIDVSKITDLSPDNVFASDQSMNQLMYFKNNGITNISQVYRSGFYGTKNTDTTTPYRAYWFVVVFCKDVANQIAVQWAMDVGKAHNGELWMRTVRLNAPSTADGNYIGPWKKLLNTDDDASAVTAIFTDETGDSEITSGSTLAKFIAQIKYKLANLVPVTRTINGVDLSEDRTLNIVDMGDISTGALSGWYTDYVDQGSELVRYGNIVLLNIRFKPTANGNVEGKTVATLPEGFRPSADIMTTFNPLLIRPDGKIHGQHSYSLGANALYTGAVMFIAAN